MTGLDTLQNLAPTGDQTVPDALFGCWRRNWIRFGTDGELDDSVAVIWLQTASGMGDLRIAPEQDLHDNDSSCGITVVDDATTPYPTADWLDGKTGFAQQPVSNFPEKGWLDWKQPSLLHELAPSGAYVEEWQRLPESSGPVTHLVDPSAETTTNLYIAGNHLFLAVRDTTTKLHEFSWASTPTSTQPAVVHLSTHSDRVGAPPDLDRPWQVVSYRPTDRSTG